MDRGSNNQPNYVNTFYYTPYVFGDPTDTYEEACTVCLTTNQNITAQNTSSVLAIYGTPTNIFPNVLPLQRAYGHTTANSSTAGRSARSCIKWAMRAMSITVEPMGLAH